MSDLLREQKLYLKYVEQCDRILRRSILVAILIGAVFFLWAEIFVIRDEFSFLAMAFVLGFGVPILYYNISVAIFYHRFLKLLEGEESPDERIP